MASSINDLVTKASSGTRPSPTTLNATKAIGASSISCAALTGWNTTTAVHFIIYNVDSNGKKVAGSQTDWKGLVSGTSITGLVLKAGTDNGYGIGAVVEAAPTAAYADDLYAGFTQDHDVQGRHSKLTDTNGNKVLGINATASAVNNLTDTNAAAGGAPILGVEGSDSNINMGLKPKGTGGIYILDGNGNEIFKAAAATASAVNELTAANAATGNAPTLSTSGDDTNIWGRLQGKGSGQFLPQLGIQSATISNTGAANAVAATLNFPAVPFATKIILFGCASAALSSGAPTLSWINWILRGSTTGGVGIASGDNTKSAATGITESRITTLMAVESVAANTAQAYVWMVGSTTTTTTSGNFFGIQVAA